VGVRESGRHLVVVGGLAVGELLGDEVCGMDVQEEKRKEFPVLMKRKVGAAAALVCPTDM
jgi:hypothetical protein